MQTRGKTSMARQIGFKQTSGNKSEHRKCASKIKQQIKQSNRSSKQTDQANKQIKQTSRSSKQAKSPREAFTFLSASRPDKKKSNEQAANKSECRMQGQQNRTRNMKQSNRSSKPTKSTSGSVSCSFARPFVQRGFRA